jgi:glucokinase
MLPKMPATKARSRSVPDLFQDSRTVMTLDAGGSSFRFSAMRSGKPVTEMIVTPSDADDLDRCLKNIIEGFDRVRADCPEPPVAISFAFPGPSDYTRGIIGDLPNLPAFRGGVALGPMLEDHYGIPVFINNDGDLFVYGEAIGGLLPWMNGLLEEAGSAKRYKNLFGVTARNGDIFLGDNAIGCEVQLLHNKLNPAMRAEEGANIRAVRRVFAEKAGIRFEQAPDPKTIAEIGSGTRPGNRGAAIEAYRQLGEVVGEALAQALTLVDGLAVIGGGISGAWPLFLPAVLGELNRTCPGVDGNSFRRLIATAFSLEDPTQREKFLKDDSREIIVPGSKRTVKYDPVPRIGVGISRLGTSHAIAVGAYAFALRHLK